MDSTRAWPSVTVVSPCLNMGKYLNETIESVLDNLRPGDQYFVVDGGSTDGSVELIRAKERSLSAWISERDDGYAHALAKGFSRATGDILCWINAGDRLASGALDLARQSLERTGADLIFGDDFYFDESNRVLAYSRGYVPNLKNAMLYGGWTPLQDACFWRRSLYEKVGGVDPDLKFAADYDLFLRMALCGKSAYVPSVFSGFRRHAGQKSISGSQKYREEREKVRHRELTRTSGTAIGKVVRSLWYGATIRWRVHVAQRSWRRPDLVGEPVANLKCDRYWPAPADRK